MYPPLGGGDVVSFEQMVSEHRAYSHPLTGKLSKVQAQRFKVSLESQNHSLSRNSSCFFRFQSSYWNRSHLKTNNNLRGTLGQARELRTLGGHVSETHQILLAPQSPAEVIHLRHHAAEPLAADLQPQRGFGRVSRGRGSPQGQSSLRVASRSRSHTTKLNLHPFERSQRECLPCASPCPCLPVSWHCIRQLERVGFPLRQVLGPLGTTDPSNQGTHWQV